MRRNSFDNPLFIIALFFLTVIVNTILSIYFMLITLAGVIFIAFYVCLKREYYYSLVVCIASFLFIEINAGLKPFSLSLLSLFIYLYIIPIINRSMSFSKLNTYIYMLAFYLGMLILWSFIAPVNDLLIYNLIINIFIDFLFFGVLI
jgi:hypothetical protein